MDFRFYMHLYVCCKEEQFDFVENSESIIYLSDGSSCAIRGIETVSWMTYDGIVRKLGEIRYISDFKRNLILLSRLDSRGYRTIAGREILKVLRGERIILKEKKRTRGYYYLIEAQCKVELQKPGGAQNEMELQVEIDWALDRRLERTRGNIIG